MWLASDLALCYVLTMLNRSTEECLRKPKGKPLEIFQLICESENNRRGLEEEFPV